jgi:hypothetical protein
MTMSTADILRGAKEHISDPAMWYQGNYFPDANHFEVPPDDAPCCPFGAVQWATQTWTIDLDLIETLNRQSGDGGIVAYNDAETTTHDDIMALFDRAIELAEAAA